MNLYKRPDHLLPREIPYYKDRALKSIIFLVFERYSGYYELHAWKKPPITFGSLQQAEDFLTILGYEIQE